MNKDKKSPGWYAGQAVGVTITVCIIAILIAVTAKIVLWIL